MEDTNLSIAENQEVIRQKAQEIAKTLDPAKPETLTHFGLETQRKLGHYSNELLTRVKAKDAGDAGTAINELLAQISQVRVDEAEKPNRLSRMMGGIPFMKKFVDKSKQIASRYNSIAENVDEVVLKLEKTRQSLLKDSSGLEVMFRQAVEYIQEVRAVIAAGSQKVEELEAEDIPRLQAAVEASGQDELAVQQLSDLIGFKDRLEKKVHDLRLSIPLPPRPCPRSA